MKPRRISRAFVAAAACLAAALLAAGCDSPPASQGKTSLEKTNVVVGTVPVTGAAGLYIAQEEGLFAKQGLHVTVDTVGNPLQMIPALLSGKIDVMNEQWTSDIAADAAGVAKLHALANAQALGPHAHELIALPSSGIHSPAQLKGKTIGIVSLNSLDTILVGSVLSEYGLSSSQYHTVAVPFQDMGAALASHRVDAVEPAEPWVTEIEAKYGAVAIADMDQGAVLNFPISGYAVTDQWFAKYPHTAAAFAKAIHQGQLIASTNRAALQRAVSRGAHIPSNIADVMADGSYPATVDRVQLQRVADLMLKYNQIKHAFNVAVMTR